MNIDELRRGCAAKWKQLGVTDGYSLGAADQAKVEALKKIQAEADATAPPGYQPRIGDLAAQLAAI